MKGSVFQIILLEKHEARVLRDEQEISSIPSKRKGKRLLSSIEAAVLEFYDNVDVSTVCPGNKNYITVKISGQKVQKQKRLLLCSLKELHQQFVKNTVTKIGITPFCGLCPKWCTKEGASSTHSACFSKLNHQLDYYNMTQKLPGLSGS